MSRGDVTLMLGSKTSVGQSEVQWLAEPCLGTESHAGVG